MKPKISYAEFIRKELSDSDFAAAYLNDAINDGDPKLLLIALKDVADAYGGMKRLAGKAKLSRESLYKMLSKDGNPGIYSLKAVLDALGFVIRIDHKSGGDGPRRIKAKKATSKAA